MRFKAFSDWVVVREQTAPAPAAPQAPAQPKGSTVDSEIKQVIVANVGKPKSAQVSALAALVKKKQADPKTTPKDLQAIADVMSPADQTKK